MAWCPSYFIIFLNVLKFYRWKKEKLEEYMHLECYISTKCPYTEGLLAVCLISSLPGSALIPTLALAMKPHEISIHLFPWITLQGFIFMSEYLGGWESPPRCQWAYVYSSVWGIFATQMCQLCNCFM